MISLSIRRKIMGIAVVLIALMAVTALLSMASVIQVGGQLDELTQSYIPAYGNLARANIRSVERALELRRLIIEKLLSSSNDVTALRARFDAKGGEFDNEIEAARKLIGGLIEKNAASGDTRLLVRLQVRLDAAVDDSRRHLNDEISRLLNLLEAGDASTIDESLSRVDALRDELNSKLDGIRADMLVLLRADADLTAQRQRRVTLIAAFLTLLAAVLGLVFSLLVSAGVTRPVRRLLEGAKAVEAGNLDEQVPITSKDEIGHLTTAFNQMIEQLRLKERIRETFGKYIDPRIVEGLIDRPMLAVEGQRRVMTVLFCDVRGFTSTSEGMTPQGLVKVMNRYFSTMSAPIRDHEGIIDKYIGDAIMAYWGPPFTDDAAQARLASLAALKMLELVPQLRTELPELLGVRTLPTAFDLRIGIATGDVLVGSIGSEWMKNYTVMGDTVNLASRLEGANKEYGGRILVSEATMAGASDAVDAREIDRVAVLGQNQPQAVFEIMAGKGELSPAQLKLRDRFSEGLSRYRRREWDESRRAFAAALAIVPNDGPSITFINRLDKFILRPPGENWDGSWRLEQK
ncbi:adenylate/guanylate cyclase domain-containing protein [Bradyrhizobium sp. 2S1]|uniref:adenylate/guanylate cyclase domain-containing protein n=1 Tax=Bradyrhizobium sp. 2S1 TaxID=1404429 RepID=UPI00140766CE|nr:adenylate/guanylate cyclase domain-containing protein [Bradyrhizobium sp. 2S1]MCK7674068.1 HAMP domain-containing protein [Bradyrhizobium sp. 2S1]